MTAPSLRKLEVDLNVNKTTLHNWKKNRPVLYEFIIESDMDMLPLKKPLESMIKQQLLNEEDIDNTKKRIV